MYKIGIAYSNKKYNSVLNGQGKVNGKKQRKLAASFSLPL